MEIRRGGERRGGTSGVVKGACLLGIIRYF